MKRLPDDFTYILTRPTPLTERILVERMAPIGKKGKLVPISYVVSTARGS